MPKRHKRNFRIRVKPVPAQQPIREWQIVMAELKQGVASVGIRFNREDTVHFFALNKTPQEAAQIVADVAKGKITLRDIAGYDWRAVELPYSDMEEVNHE